MSAATTGLPASVELPAWRGGKTLRPLPRPDAALRQYEVLGIVLAEEPDEDALTYLEQIVGYAWRANMTGVPPIGDGRVSVHGTVVVVDAAIAFRRSRSRSREQATHDLVNQIRGDYRDGSPERRDGTRLVDRPTAVQLPELIGFMIG
ncbi:hypothetical protein [Prescottella agglutinans]|uniref:Uncharacterized protein n=1 Tax=Prescottella agglutinans TaxID=1644129 RepID=A0ABT6MI23_9NOCA|nr:hypothetical protein [Prescottella agglutinans]MDH6283965.1 hypothetical protein [Prescottella agglutinans]